MRILVTGSAGFIGFHLARRFLERGDKVLGIDNLNDYYDVSLKQARLRQLEPFKNFRFRKIDIADRGAMEELFAGRHCEEHQRRSDTEGVILSEAKDPIDGPFDCVVHMAAQAGVRYSIENPHAYVQSNLVGFMNILEGCRKQWARGVIASATIPSPLPSPSRGEGEGGGDHEIASAPMEPRNDGSRNTSHQSPVTGHLVFASSSSVYGLNTKMPFSVHDNVDHPISLYAATKKANELMAHSYSYLYGIPTTGLRFFTVYGPWGRPDMALFKFTKAILKGEPIDVYNEGKMRRDFTYIDDIVEGVVRVTDRIPAVCHPEARAEGSREHRDSSPEPALLARRSLGVGGSKAEGAQNDNRMSTTTHVSHVTGHAPYRLYNIGNHNPVELLDFIHAIEDSLGKKAKMNFLPMQPGDVPATYADVDDLIRDVGFSPSTPVQEGIKRFAEWYKKYYS